MYGGRPSLSRFHVKQRYGLRTLSVITKLSLATPQVQRCAQPSENWETHPGSSSPNRCWQRSGLPQAMRSTFRLRTVASQSLPSKDGRGKVGRRRSPRSRNLEKRTLLGSSSGTRATTNCSGEPEPQQQQPRHNARGGVARRIGSHHRQRNPEDTPLPDRVASRNERPLAYHHRRANDDRQPSGPFPYPRPLPRQIGSHPAGAEPPDKPALVEGADLLQHARHAAGDVRGIDAAIVGPPPRLAANDRAVELFHREAGSNWTCQNTEQIGSISLGVDDVWGRIALRHRLESRSPSKVMRAGEG
jgi:hypothetical protein